LQEVQKQKKKMKKEKTHFMPNRSRDNLGKKFPNTPTTSNNQPSLFFCGCELEDPLGEQPKIFEELIEEEEDIIPPTYAMDENRNERGDIDRA